MNVYYKFTLDSRSELGQSSELVKKYNEVQPDIEFSGKLGTKILIKGLVAKFTQHKELHDLLMATKNATLLEYVVKKPAKINTELMTIRKNLMV